MKVSIYAPYAKERLETARSTFQFCILNESSASRKKFGYFRLPRRSGLIHFNL
jgi:hypothetical protein